METLTKEFEEALTRVEVSGARRLRAQEAHVEVRGVLEADATLKGWGIDTVLIGSYARHTSIHPGKDVDVFSKLDSLDAQASPTTVFNTMRSVLVEEYGNRAEAQDRSIKVLFDDHDGFSIDAVPAVHMADRWGIPNRDTAAWEGDSKWTETDPEKLTSLTTDLNRRVLISGRGAYVPVVKLVRQTRRFHLGEEKPGGLYFELMTFWLFAGGLTAGSWAELFAVTLRGIHEELRRAADDPVNDPALQRPFEPKPDPSELATASDRFDKLASKGEAALHLDECAAAVQWRSILGTNDRGQVFPLPDGCDDSGHRIAPIEAVTRRGSREASSFGNNRNV